MVLKQVSICINFSLNANWRSIAWLSIFWNLHIFIGVQQICHLVKAKRKVKIPIFIIWNSHGRSGPEVISVRSHTSLRVFTALGQFREELSRTYFRVFGTWHNLEKLGRNTTNHKLEHRQNNPKCLTLYVRSNEVLVQGQVYLRVGFHLF